jgi:hypothetical protein
MKCSTPACNKKRKKGKTNYTIEKKRKKEKKTGLVIITIPV